MPPHYRGTPEEIRALNVYIKLQRAADSVMERTNAHLSAYRLTTSQFAVLEALYHLGTLAQVDLARKLLQSTSNITTVLQNLEKRGLVCRERSTADQRVVKVSITAEGHTLIESILPAHVARIAADMAILSAEEQETLAALCRKLGLRVAP